MIYPLPMSIGIFDIEFDRYYTGKRVKCQMNSSGGREKVRFGRLSQWESVAWRYSGPMVIVALPMWSVVVGSPGTNTRL